MSIYLIQGLTHVSLLGCAGASILLRVTSGLRSYAIIGNVEMVPRGRTVREEESEILLRNRTWLPRFFVGEGKGSGT